MNRTDAASLAFRLLGIWFLVLTLQFVAQTLFWALEGEEEIVSSTPYLGAALIGFAVYFFGSWFLLSKAQELAVRFYPPPAEKAEGKSAGPAAWQAAALAVLGIWLIADSLPDLVTVLLGANAETVPASFWIQQPIFHPVLRLLIGLVLALGCHRIARWWERDAARMAESRG